MAVDPYPAIITALEAAQVPYERLEHAPVFTSEQAAAVRGLSLAQGAKALLFKAKVGFVLVVLPGNRRVDSKKLRQLLGVNDVRFASPDEVQAQMGCTIGSCYPLGYLAGLRTLVDASLGANARISFNPGRHDVSITMRYQDYVRLAQPETVSVVTAA